MALVITWDTESTVQLPGGGDAIRTTNELLELDIVETDALRMAAKLSTHAVEQGIEITDHTEPEPDRYTVTANISERPIDIFMVEGSTSLATLPSGARATAIVPPAGTSRKADALEALRDLVRNAQLVNVEGGPRALEDYQIESVSTPRKVDDAGLLVAQIVFVEHRTAELEEVSAPSPRVERGRNGQDNGRGSTEGENDETASSAPENRSVSARALDATVQGVRSLFGGGSNTEAS